MAYGLTYKSEKVLKNTQVGKKKEDFYDSHTKNLTNQIKNTEYTLDES